MMSQHEHETLGQLLPWYANGTLDHESRRKVAHHLEQCDACRDELAFLGDIRAVLRITASRDDAPVIRHAGFRSLPPELQQRVLAGRPRLARRRYWMPALAASFLAAVGLGVALGVSWLDAPRYRTAASGGSAGANHVQVAVTFAPGASLEQLSAVLREHDAVIVNAPADERWLLEIPAGESRDASGILSHLRAHPGVIGAEPVTRGAGTE